MNGALGPVLVVFAEAVDCPKCGHQMQVITDGTRLYADGIDQDDTIERRGSVISFACPDLDPAFNDVLGVRCLEDLSVDIASPYWVEATDAHRSLLDQDAAAVSRVDITG